MKQVRNPERKPNFTKLSKKIRQLLFEIGVVQ